jgi:hypothetical protein
VQGSVVDNRYDIVQPLGSGGMGEVYLAHDMTLGRDVALKLLRSQFANDRESAERFKREALSAARLSHPNIVQVYDRGDTEDGSSYIAMEYVPGGTLKDRIVQDGPLDPRVAASYGYQVAGALGVAHSKGVIHRDIKPQNVLITPSGEAKVADFGIARALSSTTDSHTKTGTVMGTAGYMSPEQALGESATPKSDLYSLGIVLYEAVTGKLPFTAENPIAVSMKHVNEPPRPPQQLNPDVPDGMNAVILKLLAKDPADRYASADDLAEDLLRVRRGAPPIAAAVQGETKTVQAPPPGPAPTTRQPAAPRSRRRRTRGPLILGLLLLLLGLLGLAWGLGQGLGFLGGQGVSVPSVEGLPQDQAESRLDDAGLTSEIRTQESSDVEAGTVISQSPTGGESVAENSTVTLTVARSSTVTVPEVIGMNVSDAEAELEGAGLTVGSRFDVPSDSAAEGIVVDQSVAAGQEISSGTAVDLSVSSGATAPASASPAPASPSPEPTSVPAEDPGADQASPAPSEGGQAPRRNQNQGQGQNPGQGQGQGQGPVADPSAAPASAQPGGGGDDGGDD